MMQDPVRITHTPKAHKNTNGGMLDGQILMMKFAALRNHSKHKPKLTMQTIPQELIDHIKQLAANDAKNGAEWKANGYQEAGSRHNFASNRFLELLDYIERHYTPETKETYLVAQGKKAELINIR
jgi:hypothetical protein